MAICAVILTIVLKVGPNVNGKLSRALLGRNVMKQAEVD